MSGIASVGVGTELSLGLGMGVQTVGFGLIYELQPSWPATAAS